MKDFLLGMLLMWVILSAYLVLADECGWYEEEWFFFSASAPVSIPILLFAELLYRPFRLLIHPVVPRWFQREILGFPEHTKTWHLSERVWMCYQRNAKPWRRIYFVRTRKED